MGLQQWVGEVLSTGLPGNFPVMYLNPPTIKFYKKVCMCAKSLQSNSLWQYGLHSTRLLCSWDSSGENTGVGCHTLLQGIFPTQRLNLHLLTSAALAGRFFTTSTTRYLHSQFFWSYITYLNTCTTSYRLVSTYAATVAKVIITSWDIKCEDLYPHKL